jgi:tRNA threonylcarbamoyl adenosine modification protein (Sua5/YciO/YrdC/YwlC family)
MAQVLTVHPTNPQPRLLRLAAQAVRDGGVIAYPTDSSYALGCRLDDAEAARRVRAIRGLDERHHLTLMCRSMADIGHFARLDNWQFRIVRQGTPGSFTYLLPATHEVPRRLQHPRRKTIGVRIPDHAIARALLDEVGAPILSTTLIAPGSSEPLNAAEAIQARLGASIDAIIDAGPCAATPTTVVDLAQTPPVIVRRGRGDPARLGIELR